MGTTLSPTGQHHAGLRYHAWARLIQPNCVPNEAWPICRLMVKLPTPPGNAYVVDDKPIAHPQRLNQVWSFRRRGAELTNSKRKHPKGKRKIEKFVQQSATASLRKLSKKDTFACAAVQEVDNMTWERQTFMQSCPYICVTSVVV